MNEIEFYNYIRFFGCCSIVMLMMSGVCLVVVFVYYLIRRMLAEVAGKPRPKLTREGIADRCQNNKAKAYDIFDDI